MNKSLAVTALLAALSAPAPAQSPGQGQVFCWTTTGLSSYDLIGMPTLDAGVLSYQSQEGLGLIQTGACMARQKGMDSAPPQGRAPAVQCYDPNGTLIYSAEAYSPYAADGGLVWIEVETGDFLVATSALRCDTFVFEK